jgi:hypothetical protein
MISNFLFTILQTYSKKIDTSGIEIIIVLIIIVIWFLMTGGKKVNKLNNYKTSVVLNPTKINNKKNDNSFQHRMILLNVDELYKSIDYSYNQYNDVSKEEYDILLSYKNTLIQNVNYIELIKPKVNSLYQKYVTPEDMRMIFNFDIFDRDYIFGNKEFLSPFQDKVQSEFEKCNFSLFGKKLKFITTNQFPVLINDDGYIYLYNLSDKFRNDMVYIGELTFPIEYLDHLEFDLSNSKFDLSLNVNYLREVLKRIEHIEKFENYLNKLIVFNNNKVNSKKDPVKFFYNTVKENYKINLSELVELLFKNNGLSLNEYLINVELGRFEFDIEYVLKIIFDTRYIGSFFNKKRSELKITKTSLKLLSIDELILFYKQNYPTKELFYKRFELNDYFSNLRFDSLNNIENYKKTFDYWVFNRTIDKQNKFNLPETSIPYFSGSIPNKMNFLEKNLFINDVSDNLVDLVESELRKVENEIRVSKGFKIVGSYTNESILYVKLKEYFTECKVISQGRPEWLGRQSLDIYFPEYNIGVEYQGEQHFRPIDFFGGIEKFNLQKNLDEKKKELCISNNCSLIEVKEDYVFEDLVFKIKQVIDSK